MISLVKQVFEGFGQKLFVNFMLTVITTGSVKYNMQQATEKHKFNATPLIRHASVPDRRWRYPREKQYFYVQASFLFCSKS